MFTAIDINKIVKLTATFQVIIYVFYLYWGSYPDDSVAVGSSSFDTLSYFINFPFVYVILWLDIDNNIFFILALTLNALLYAFITERLVKMLSKRTTQQTK